MPNPSPPTTGLTYTLYETPLSLDLTTIPWTQSPPCDYVATEVVTWNNPEPYVVSVNPFVPLQLSIFTIDKTKLGDHTLTVTNTITYGGVTWTPSYSFDITIVDPCDSTSLITQSIDTLTTDNGVVGTVDFNDVNDTHEVSKGLYSLCGPRAYTIAY